MSTQKALELLGLPAELAPYEGQIQTRLTRQLRIYEVSDFTTSPMKTYYTAEIMAPVTQLFGLYPFNYAAGSLYHMGFSAPVQSGSKLVMERPSTWVVHPAESGLAGQRVYYVAARIVFEDSAEGTSLNYMWEPYETVLDGKAEDMKDPLITAAYYARVINKGADGQPRISWTSRYAIKPKRRLRRAEVLKMLGMNIDQLIYALRWTMPVTKVSNDTHITSIAMDIEQLPSNKLKSVVYINGKDANSFDYKKLINSFGKTYDGYMQMYRLNNGPRPTTTTVDNVYGSTLNIGVNPLEDSSITVVPGSVNTYDVNTKTLTYNPDLVETAMLIAYMEFLPAGGKNENVGKELNLETGEERLF